jgi:hypothetical protein
MVSRAPIYGLLLYAWSLTLAAGPFEVWHSRNPLPTSATLKSVAYGNGRFIAVGNNGIIVSSTNGVDWALQTSGVSRQLKTVAFANGRFVIGGNSGLILWSDDGEQWKSATVPAGNNVDVIGFGAGTNSPNGVFVALASTNSPPGALSLVSTILTSSNALNWWTNAHFYSGGSSPGPQYGPYSSIAFGNQRFVVSSVSSIGTPFSPAITSSANATNWEFSLGIPIGPVAFGNGIFVIVSYFQVTSNGLATVSGTSTDGYTWPGLNFSGSAYLPLALCFGEGRFVAVGQHGSVSASPDGTNRTTQLASTDADLQSVAYGAGLYVAVGIAGLIMTSSDGLTWTQRNQGPTGHLYTVASSSDTGFIAAGTAGAIARSTNGISWEDI